MKPGKIVTLLFLFGSIILMFFLAFFAIYWPMSVISGIQPISLEGSELITEGMSQSEVCAVLNDPNRVYQLDDGEEWIYSREGVIFNVVFSKDGTVVEAYHPQ